MTVPTWDQYMVPSLRVLSDGQVHQARQIIDASADLLRVTAEQRAILIPSGQVQYRNRGNWALSDLFAVQAVERPVRGHYRITDVGRRLLADHPAGITRQQLHDWAGISKPSRVTRPPSQPTVRAVEPILVDDSALDPEEQIEAGVARINADVEAQLLSRILSREPEFFEQAVLNLLVAMGYGGAEGKATRTQLSHDGGIDGIIDQDALGLSRIYVQAKRYAAENTVGREAIQAFVGALAGNQANQGVFITTSRFARTAIAYADSVASRIILIDGERLARLMIRYGVGVQTKRTVRIVQIDEDFFE